MLSKVQFPIKKHVAASRLQLTRPNQPTKIWTTHKCGHEATREILHLLHLHQLVMDIPYLYLANGNQIW